MESLALLLLCVLPVLLGWALSRFVFRRLGLGWKLLALFGLALAVGAASGTIHTHAFDILWWWQGVAWGLLALFGVLIHHFTSSRRK
jgi:hypothetical protein